MLQARHQYPVYVHALPFRDLVTNIDTVWIVLGRLIEGLHLHRRKAAVEVVIQNQVAILCNVALGKRLTVDDREQVFDFGYGDR